MRFREDRLAMFDALSEQSGWNRNQVVDALADAGLLLLFSKLSNSTANMIKDELVAKILKSRR